jgi:hypothetical protein
MQHRSTDTRIGYSTDTRISNNNIITNNSNKFFTRKRGSLTLVLANPMVKNRVDTIPTQKSSRISSLSSDSDIAERKVSTHLLATAIRRDNPFVMLALEQIQTAIFDDKSPTKQVLDREDYEPPPRRLMLQCKQLVKWE